MVRPTSLIVRLTAAALVAALAGSTLPAGAGSPAQFKAPTDQPRCAEPTTGGVNFEARTPAELGFDAAALQAALTSGDADSRVSNTVVIRHGCLAASYQKNSTLWRRYQAWSASKSLVALSAGAAMQAGELSWDDPLGSMEWFTDRSRGVISLDDIANQTTGWRYSFFSDFGVGGPNLLPLWFYGTDVVRNQLGEPRQFEPGTVWNYQQGPITLGGELVARAVGEPLKRFDDRALMGPMGIPAADWRWQTDRAGHPLGFMGVELATPYWARIGQLLLQNGVYAGQRLVPARFVREIRTPSTVNPIYSHLFWNNTGIGGQYPNSPFGRSVVSGRAVPTAPADMYYILGMLGQLVVVVPSLDLVVVRNTEGNSDLFGIKSMDVINRVIHSINDGSTAGLPAFAPMPNYVDIGRVDPGYDLAGTLADAANFVPKPLPWPVPPRPRALVLQRLTNGPGGLVVDARCPSRQGTKRCAGTVAAAGGAAAYTLAAGQTASVTLPGVNAADGTDVAITATNTTGSRLIWGPLATTTTTDLLRVGE